PSSWRPGTASASDLEPGKERGGSDERPGSGRTDAQTGDAADAGRLCACICRRLGKWTGCDASSPDIRAILHDQARWNGARLGHLPDHRRDPWRPTVDGAQDPEGLLLSVRTTAREPGLASRLARR